MDQYAVIELSEEEVIKIIKKNLEQGDNAQAPTDFDVIFKYDEDEEVLTTTIIKNTTICGYRGSIREDIEEDDIIEMMCKEFEDDDDYSYDAHEIIYETSVIDPDKKIFKGISLIFDLENSYGETFVKAL